jgi:hypothetical protein
MIRGSGYVNPPLAQTGFVDVTVPCNVTITVSKHLMFYGVPPALVAPTVTPDYNLSQMVGLSVVVVREEEEVEEKEG